MALSKTRSIIFGLVLAAAWTCTDMALGQAPLPGQPGAPTTVEVRRAAEKAALSDKRMRAILGEGQFRVASGDVEMDKGEAERFLEGTSDKRPSSRVIVVALNLQANIAARAVVSVPHYRVLEVERVAPDNMPLVSADAEDALALAKASPEVRSAVGETLALYRIREPGSQKRIPFAAEVLAERRSDPADPCSVDRCLSLIFGTDNGYLNLSVRVDLTGRTATVEGGGQLR
jgi:hypothetical protein